MVGMHEVSPRLRQVGGGVTDRNLMGHSSGWKQLSIDLHAPTLQRVPACLLARCCCLRTIPAAASG